MRRYNRIDEILKYLLVVFMLMGIIACSDSLSGFGAETTNGDVSVTVTGDISYDSCIVQIIPKNFNPVVLDTINIEYERYTSDSGIAKFSEIKSGKYTVFTKNLITGKRSIITNISINGDTSISTNLNTPGNIQVTFKNSESVLDTTNGCLFIYGYPEYVKLNNNVIKVDSGYSVMFDSVPEAVIRTLSYTSKDNGTFIQNISDSVPVVSEDTTYVYAELYYTFVNSSNSEYIPDTVQNFLIGSNNIRWVVNGEQLLKIDNDTVLEINNTNHNIAPGKINTIYEGHDKAIWIGTDEGVSVTTDYHSWKTYRSGNNIKLKNVTSIVDNDSIVFIGTFGGGLHIFKNNKWSLFTKKNKFIPSDSITALIIDREGDLLAGTTQGIFNLVDTTVYIYKNINSYSKSIHITSLAQDSSEGFWIGTCAGEILHLTDTLWLNYSMAVNSSSDNSITSIVCDSRGDVWAGSAEGRFYRYPKDANINGWLVYIGSEGILPGVSITSIDVSQKRLVYCSTKGSGIFVLGTSSIEVDSSWRYYN